MLFSKYNNRSSIPLNRLGILFIHMELSANVGDLLSYTCAQVGVLYGIPGYWEEDSIIQVYGIVINAEMHNVVAAQSITDIYASAFYDVYFFDGMISTINEIDFELGFARVISKAEVLDEEESA